MEMKFSKFALGSFVSLAAVGAMTIIVAALVGARYVIEHLKWVG